MPKAKTGFPGASAVKNPPANARDSISIPGLGRSPGEGNGNPLQHSCLGNLMDWGAWQAAVHGCQKSRRTQLSGWTTRPRHRSQSWYVLAHAFVRIHVLLLTCVLMAACYVTPMCVTSKCTWTCMHVNLWVVTVPVWAIPVHPPEWTPLTGRGVKIWKQ